MPGPFSATSEREGTSHRGTSARASFRNHHGPVCCSCIPVGSPPCREEVTKADSVRNSLSPAVDRRASQPPRVRIIIFWRSVQCNVRWAPGRLMWTSDIRIQWTSAVNNSLADRCCADSRCYLYRVADSTIERPFE